MYRFLIICLSSCLPILPSWSADRPNIILIMSDDMGYSDLGCYGGEINTPNLDKLAANGLRFSQFYNTGRCCPTRASLLTGLYPHQAGIGHMTGDYGLPSYRGDLNKQCLTIAEALKPAGYRTYMSGKWHVTPVKTNKDGEPDRHNWPRQRGFDRFYGTIHGAGSFFDPNTLTRDNAYITPENDPEYQPKGTWYYTDAISDNTVRHIHDHASNNPDQPFFHYVAYTAAHWPMHALPEDIAKYDGKYDRGYAPVRDARIAKLKELGLLPDHWAPAPLIGDWDKVQLKDWESACMEVYAAMVDNMDQGIGRIIKALEETRQLDNTLILFLQDNGGCAEGFGRGKLVGPLERPDKPTLPPLGKDTLQRDMVPSQSRDGYPLRRGDGVMPGPPETEIGYGQNWANVSNTPFREYKHWVHEGGIATPLIAHWPKGIANTNSWHHQPTHLIDIMATALDLSGATYPQDKTPIEGISLKPSLNGKSWIRTSPIFFEHEGNRAVRDGKWKLVAKGTNGPWELYDMEKDRTESNNLAAKHPDRLAKMISEYAAWAERAGVVPFGSWNRNKPHSKLESSGRKAFDLKPGTTLNGIESPDISNKAFTVTATITDLPATGVIVAHGGSNLGWALHLSAGLATFTTRTGDGKQQVVSAPLRKNSPQTIEARVLKKALVLRINDAKPIRKECSPLLPSHPIDGLQVGEDTGGLVGNYTEDNRFTGTLKSVRLEIK